MHTTAEAHCPKRGAFRTWKTAMSEPVVKPLGSSMWNLSEVGLLRRQATSRQVRSSTWARCFKLLMICSATHADSAASWPIVIHRQKGAVPAQLQRAHRCRFS